MFHSTPHSHLHNTLEFQVFCETHFGQEVRICGNTIQLGNWNPLLSHKLITDQKTYPRWKSVMPVGVMNPNTIEFKACIIANNTISWQRNIENRKICCHSPTTVEFFFNQPKEIVTEKKVTEIECRQGTFDILQQMQGSESSIEFKSNYPIEKYFLHQESSLQHSREYSCSEMSSNLLSPNGKSEKGQTNCDQQSQFEYHQLQYARSICQLDNYTIKCQKTRELIQRRTIEPPLENDLDGIDFNNHAQSLISRRDRSHSRSLERSDSGKHKKSESPSSHFMVHVPSIESLKGKTEHQNQTQQHSDRILKVNTLKFKEESKLVEKLSISSKECKMSTDVDVDSKSTSTVTEYETEDQYLTTREEDVIICQNNDDV